MKAESCHDAKFAQTFTIQLNVIKMILKGKQTKDYTYTISLFKWGIKFFFEVKVYKKK